MRARAAAPWAAAAVCGGALVVVLVLRQDAAGERDRANAEIARLKSVRDEEVRRLRLARADLRGVRLELRRTRLELATPAREALADHRFALAFVRGSFPHGASIVVVDPRRPERERVLVRPKVEIQNFNWMRRGRAMLLKVMRSPFTRELGPDGLLVSRGDLEPLCLGSPDAAAGGTRLLCGPGQSVSLALRGRRPRPWFDPVKHEAANSFSSDWTLSPRGAHVASVDFAAVEPAPYYVSMTPTRRGGRGGSTDAPSELWRKSALAWSPDGTRLAYSATRTGDLLPSDGTLYAPLGKGVREAVVVVGLDGRVLARIPNAARPAWSPDGRLIAFDSDRSGRRQIYVANRDGSDARQLTRGPRASWRPRWRP